MECYDVIIKCYKRSLAIISDQRLLKDELWCLQAKIEQNWTEQNRLSIINSACYNNSVLGSNSKNKKDIIP